MGVLAINLRVLGSSKKMSVFPERLDWQVSPTFLETGEFAE